MSDQRSIWPDLRQEGPYAVLVIGVLFILFLGGITWIIGDLRAIQFIGRAPETPNTITVLGEGKVTGVPDIATISLGVLSSGPKVADVQLDNTRKMNDLIARLKALGIVSKDLQTTQYSITPRYDYTNGRSVLAGYDVQQTVLAKVRDLAKVSDVLTAAGAVGANQIGDLNFTIDEPEALRAVARRKAVENAREKANALASAAGVQLTRVVSFSENVVNDVPGPIPFAARAEGLGGGPALAPNVQSGSLDITSDVTLSYEIR